MRVLAILRGAGCFRHLEQGPFLPDFAWARRAPFLKLLKRMLRRRTRQARPAVPDAVVYARPGDVVLLRMSGPVSMDRRKSMCEVLDRAEERLGVRFLVAEECDQIVVMRSGPQ